MAIQQNCARCGAPITGGRVGGHCTLCLLTVSLTPPPDPGADHEVEEDRLPREFGEYVLEARVARGGMGIVYRARHIHLNRVVAIKMLIGGGFAGQEALRRFQAEAKSAARLHHPHIVTIYDVGECEGLPYFSMEYVEGQDLANLAHTQAIQGQQAARWLQAIALGVEHAHQQGVLHRDLKPSNIIIDLFNQPRVTDFGLARQLGSDSSLTVSGQALGSPSYMPPEQARGDHSRTGPRSDVYALGAVLYHLLTGRPPFVGDSIAAVLAQVEKDDPVRPRRLNPSTPLDLQTICLKCLEKNPERRFPTAQSLADEFGRFLRGEPILSRATTPVERVWRWCRRRPTVAALAAMLAITGMLSSAGIISQWRRAQNERRAAVASAVVAHQNEYAADMRAACDAIERGDFAEGRRLLGRHELPTYDPDPRGFEWYLLRDRARGQEEAEMAHHTSTICGVDASPDGRWLASAGMDGEVCLWNYAERKPVAHWGLGAIGWFALFTPDSKRVFTPRGTDKVALWSVPAGEVIREFPGRLASVAKETPLLVTGTGSPWFFDPAGTIRVYNYETGKLEDELPIKGHAVGLSPDGHFVAVGGEKEEVIVWDRELHRIVFRAPTAAAAWCLKFSPDSRYLAAAVMDKRVQLWDLLPELAQARNGTHFPADKVPADPEVHAPHQTPGRANTMLEEGHWLKTWSVSFSPDGHQLASTSSDRSVRLWKIPSLEPMDLRHGHHDEVWCSAYTPDGKFIVTGGKDARVMLWRVESSRSNQRPHDDSWRPPIFSPDGQKLLAFEGGPSTNITRVVFLNEDKQLEKRDYYSYGAWGRDPNGMLSFPTPSGKVRVISADNFDLEQEIPLEDFRSEAPLDSHGTGFAQDGKVFFVVYQDGWVNTWILPTGKKIGSFRTSHVPVHRTAMSADGRWLAVSQNFPYHAFLYDTLTGAERTLEGHTEFVKGLTFSPDSRQLATAGVDAKIRLWDVRTGRLITTLSGHLQEVSDVAFSPDGLTLASVESETLMKLWRLDTLREVASINNPYFGAYLSFSPDGQTLAITRTDLTIDLLPAPRP